MDCGTISSSGIYTLTTNVSSTGTCFTVTAANVTIDCNGFWITYSIGGGESFYGIYSNQFNTTVKNCNIVDGNATYPTLYNYGIYLSSSNYSNLFNNTIKTNMSHGIYLYSSSNFNIISSNLVITKGDDFGHGISVDFSSNNLLISNNITVNGSTDAIFVRASNVTLFKNRVINIGEGDGISLDGNALNCNLTSNNAIANMSGYGIFVASNNSFLMNNLGVSNSNTGIVLVSGGNSTLINNTGIHEQGSGGYGIGILSSNDNILTNNTGMSYSGNANGIFMWSVLNNTLIKNKASSLSYTSLMMNSASNNTFIDNLVESNLSNGVWLSLSSMNNVFINNTVISNLSNGIYLVQDSSNNVFINNTVTSVSIGLAMSLQSSSNLTLINNTIKGSLNGIFLYNLSNSTVKRNIANTTNSPMSLSSNLNISVIDNLLISGGSTGLSISSVLNSTIINNTIISAGSYAMYFDSSFNNILINNSATSTSDYGTAIRLNVLSNNTFINQIARTTGTIGNRYGIYIASSNNTIFRDSINISGGTYDVYYTTDTGSINNTFINCSYNTAKETVQGTGNELIRKWYYKAYVNYSNGTAAAGANVSAYNVSNSLQFTENTNASGWIQRKEVTEYINRVGTRSYFNNYSISPTKSGYYAATHIFNFTITQNKMNDFFTLGDGLIPGENSCGTLSSPGTYTLTTNVSSTGTCFTVTAANVTINCNGYWINYSTGGAASTYGITTNQLNTTVKNCNIIDGNWTSTGVSRHGIYIDGSDNSTFYNNSINVNNSYAIHMQSGGDYSNFTLNRLISSSSYGIIAQSFSRSIFINNIANARGHLVMQLAFILVEIVS